MDRIGELIMKKLIFICLLFFVSCAVRLEDDKAVVIEIYKPNNSEYKYGYQIKSRFGDTFLLSNTKYDLGENILKHNELKENRK
jgi:hypothetical protein